MGCSWSLVAGHPGSFSFSVFFKTESHCIALAVLAVLENSLCRLDWPLIHRDRPASASSSVPGLKMGLV